MLNEDAEVEVSFAAPQKEISAGRTSSTWQPLAKNGSQFSWTIVRHGH